MQRANPKGEATRPLLITGATGTLGRAFARICKERGLSYHLLSRRDMDIAEGASVERALSEYEPWAVVNTAGYVRVDDAESDAEKCLRENTTGAQTLAAVCARFGTKLVTFSSDMVFDGKKQAPYVESDHTAPLNVYGRSKLEAEREVLNLLPSALVIRTSAFFGPWDEYNFVTIALRTIASGRRFRAANDSIVSPTYVPDLVHASLDLLIDNEDGIWHLTNGEAIDWASFARRAAEMAGLNPDLVESQQALSLNLAAPRPGYSALKSERGLLLPSLDSALSRYLRDCETTFRSESAPDEQVTAAPRSLAATSS